MLPHHEMKDLMDEMFQCVFVMRNEDPNIVQKPLEEDIEEIATRLKLRGELFELHTGFSLAGGSTNTTSPATTTSST